METGEELSRFLVPGVCLPGCAGALGQIESPGVGQDTHVRIAALIQALGHGNDRAQEGVEAAHVCVLGGLDAHDRAATARDKAAQGVVAQHLPRAWFDDARGLGTPDVDHQVRIGDDVAPLEPQPVFEYARGGG